MKLRLTLFLLFILAPFSLRAADPWQPLWDGKTFAGWHIIGQGEWKIEDGAIHATNVVTQKAYGHLVTDREFTDFTIRLKFKALKGNSGLYFRVEEAGPSGVSGFQAEIDATVDVGGLYETHGRAWVSQPTPAQVATWFKPGEWNDMTVSAHGDHLTVTINGKISADLPADPGRAKGKIALQLHGAKDCDFWFKDIAIQVP